jgi:hypothetical protein
LFDVVIIGARKPEFFTERGPLFEVVTDDGLLKPAVLGMRLGGTYFGGNAPLVEAHLGLSGDEILYIGDHIYGDVHVVKNVLRWRTALIVRELETEIAAAVESTSVEAELTMLMLEKERLERVQCHVRLELQRREAGVSAPPLSTATRTSLVKRLNELRLEHTALDTRIAPLARSLSERGNARWGPLMRTGSDKSHFARQVERYADIYTSRVSNFLAQTPFAFLRSPRTSLPHDPAPVAETSSGTLVVASGPDAP